MKYDVAMKKNEVNLKHTAMKRCLRHVIVQDPLLHKSINQNFLTCTQMPRKMTPGKHLKLARGIICAETSRIESK